MLRLLILRYICQKSFWNYGEFDSIKMICKNYNQTASFVYTLIQLYLV